uniref:nucleobindin-2-like n=1 Tax=Ciona intestinalis TaxID=7719 RepID=UPI000EF53175|nr:nucleobindin-2-like [Ciona intestinalis]|eukprot:XP_026690436.1 nucleobindin-2-like [Ciona intestinalis]
MYGKWDSLFYFVNVTDVNGDGYMDSMELEAIFDKDLSKVYADNSEESIMQMEEERTRMREHVMKEVDKNNDGLITLEEFLKYSDTPEFANPDENSYKTIDQMLLEHTLYTQDELRKYRENISDQEQEIKAKLEVLKAQAKTLGGMRRELGDNRREAALDGIQEHEQAYLEHKEQQIKQQEEKIQELHKDLQQQSKEVLQMKSEMAKM